MALDGITLRAICYQLNKQLAGGKIDKINQAEKDEIILHIRKDSQRFKLLISASSMNPRIYICENYQKENPLQAPMFLMLLRKHIGSGRIVKFVQHRLERTIEIHIQAYDELHNLRTKTLISEIMGKHSNIILIDEESQNIIDSIKRIPPNISSLREVLPGRPYLLPPSQNKINPLEPLSLSNFINILDKKNSTLIKSIVRNFEGISPLLAQEICFRSSLDTDQKTAALENNQKERLFNSFIRMFESISQHDYYPNRISDNSSKGIFAFSSVRLTQFEDQYQLVNSTNLSLICEEFFSLKDLHERLDQQSSGLRKSIQVKLERLRGKLEKQVSEITEAQSLDQFRKKGELLTAHIYSLSKGMTQIQLSDFYEENAPLITISLDPQKNPSENVQWYFKKYNKSKSRIKELSNQIQQTKEEIHYLENIIYCVSCCETIEELKEIKEELFIEGYIQRLSLPKKSKKNIVKSQPMHFIATDGTSIFVGKNNIQNDQLTLSFASKEDVWLHTKQIPGSHVIIRKSSTPISNATIKEAAIIAAYYSKASVSAQVPVDYTERKHVRKPRGAKPGMVIYDHYSTIYVNPNEESIRNFKRINE